MQEAGDFAGTAFLILKPRCPERGTLTIAEINQHLDEIANGNASKNKVAVRQALGRLLRQLSAREHKWLIRIVMKDLKIGLKQQTVFSIFHEDAEDLYNVKMNLEKV
jgi:DNA ligase-4